MSLPLVEKRGRGKIGSVLLPISPSLQPLHQVLFLYFFLSLPPLPDYPKYVYYTHLVWQQEENGNGDVAEAQEEIQLKHLMPLLTPSSLHQKESQPPSAPDPPPVSVYHRIQSTNSVSRFASATHLLIGFPLRTISSDGHFPWTK